MTVASIDNRGEVFGLVSRSWSCRSTVFLLLFLILITAGFILIPTVEGAPQAHDSIFIEGDQKFTLENGVTGGVGTARDPYIIENLTITGPERYAIYIKDTTKHLLIRNITISNESGAATGIQLENVDNCLVENLSMTDLVVNVYILHSQNISVSDIDAVGGKFDLALDENVTIDGYSRTMGQRGAIFHGIMANQVEDLTISGCSIYDLGSFGMYIISCNGVTLNGNTVTNVSGTGILLKGPMGTSGNSAIDNRIEGCFIGFNFTSVPLLEIRDNQVWKNDNYGLSITDCDEVVIIDNWFQYHGMYIEDMGCDPASGFQNNTIKGILIVYAANDDDLLIEDVPSQVLVVNCTKVSITDLDLLGPIIVWDSYDVSIVGCFFEDSMLGIWVSETNWTRIRSSRFTNCTEGVVIRDCSSLLVDHCEFFNCSLGILSYSKAVRKGELMEHKYTMNSFEGSGTGMSVHHIVYGNIKWNYFYNTSEDAVYIVKSKYVNITHNEIYNCGEEGLFINECSWVDIYLNSINKASNGTLIWSMTNCNMTSNLINNSRDNGLWLRGGYGNHFVGNTIVDSKSIGIMMDGSNNFIHHNNLTGNYWSYYYPNPVQATDRSSYGNQWDDGGEGNYWSDYQAKYPEANRTGSIWDIPYEIGTWGRPKIYDRYPLVFFDIAHYDPFGADAGEDMTVDEGSEVQFDGSSPWGPWGINIDFTWNLTVAGLDVVLHGRKPHYNFTVPGTYLVELVVTDWDDHKAWDSLNVTVLDVLSPTADAGKDITAEIFSEVTFDGSGSNDTGDIVDYIWTIELEDGTIILTGKTVDYLCIIFGEFNVTLTVWDSADHHSEDTLILIVNDMEEPGANAGASREVLQFGSVELDASGSTDNVGVEQYIWTIDLESGTVTLEGKQVTYSFDEAGDYQVTLKVLDAAGNEDETQITITVMDAESPMIDLGGDLAVVSGGSIILDGSAWADNVGVVNFTWEIETPDGIVVRYGEKVDYEFDEPGSYSVNLTIKDALGNVGSDSIIVHVAEEDVTTNEGGLDLVVVTILVVLIIGSATLLLLAWNGKFNRA